MEQRGFGWIVFKRQPDKISSRFDDIPEIEDDGTDDEEFYSAKADDFIVTPWLGDDLAIPNDDASSAVAENNLLCSADLSDGYEAIADLEESVSLHEPSLYPRNNQPMHSIDHRNDQKEKNGINKDGPSPMDFDDSNKEDDKNNKPDDKTDGKTRTKSRGHYYNPIVYYTNVTGKTYYYPIL